jgi:hypothetical protein
MKPEKLVDENGNLPAYAWPGGYNIVYFDSNEDLLCADCANKSWKDPDELPDFKPVSGSIYWEGPQLFCDQCGIEIESEYGDPEEEV